MLAEVIRYLARLKNGNIEMKSKEKPSTRTGRTLSYVTVCADGFVRNEVTE